MGAARGSITLAYDERHRRRVVLAADDGTELLLDLPEAVLLREGDGLELEDGSHLVVHAAEEELCEVRCESPQALARIAWHLGNRHLPVEILEGALRIRFDPVCAEMLRGLGAEVERRRGPFTPEGGAYGALGHHAHEPHR
jgi:urease accessory protein